MGELETFIDKARAKKLDDEQIKNKLLAAGWPAEDVSNALDGLVVPKPPTAPTPAGSVTSPFDDHANSRQPIAVVQNLSVKGFEYSIMFISLAFSAFSIGALAHSFVNTQFEKAAATYQYGTSNALNSFALTLLIVSFPIFAYMFLRLKKSELEDPALKHDPSRRKWSQLMQLGSFLIGLGYIAVFVYSLIAPDNSYNQYNDNSLVKQLLHMLITLIIAGGIFIYYWRDDHKK